MKENGPTAPQDLGYLAKRVMLLECAIKTALQTLTQGLEDHERGDDADVRRALEEARDVLKETCRG